MAVAVVPAMKHRHCWRIADKCGCHYTTTSISFQSSRTAHKWTHLEEDTAATTVAAASAGDGMLG